MDALLAGSRPLTTTYRPVRPVNLRQTVGPLLRGQHEPTMRLTPNGFWRAVRTPCGVATLHAEARGGSITATAWGEGAGWVLDALPELLGRGDDWSELDLSRVPPLAEVRRQHPGLWLTSTTLVFEALVPAILEQKVTTVEARRAWRSLVLKYGEVPPGPAPEGMRVQPTPRQWQLIPSWEWHRAGVGPNRSRAIVTAAAVAAGLDRLWCGDGGGGGPATARAGALHGDGAAQAAAGAVHGGGAAGGAAAGGGGGRGELTAAAGVAGAGGEAQAAAGAVGGGAAGDGGDATAAAECIVEDVLEKLQTVHGIGPWTAAETSQRSHGHPDAVSVGDYHLAANVGWVLIGEPVDDAGMLELLEPWRGHRQRVVRLILASGVPKPRFGPRATIQDHRWH